MLTEKQKKSFGNSMHSLYSMYISSAIVGVCVCVCVSVSIWLEGNISRKNVEIWKGMLEYGLHLVVDFECFLITNSNSLQSSLSVINVVFP